MKKLIVLIAIIVLASCGKHVKNLQKTSMQDNSVIKTTDLSLTVTTEKIDTSIVIPGFLLEDAISTADTCGSDTVIKTITSITGEKLTLTYDKKNKKVSVIASKDTASLNLKIDKTTVKQNNITTDEKKNIQVKTSDRHSTHDYSVVTKYLTIGVIVVVVILLFWFFGLPKLRGK